MFYSHEILTSRKYGVATVWLVATLGARSGTKRVTKKDILGVNVKKACSTIIEPEAPMALRLQSNLLYGVSKVYDQQCFYVLHDAQMAQNALHALIKTSRTNIHDGGPSRAEPEQLMIMDDPAFLPEHALPALDFDFSNFDIHTGDSQRSTQSLMSIRRRSGSVSSSHAASMLGINLPSSSGNSGYQLPNFDPFGDSSVQKPFGGLGRDLDEEELVFQDDVGFNFTEDGELREIQIEEREALQAGAIRADGGRASSAASGRVRKEHEDGCIGAVMAGDDEYIPQLGDGFDEGILPDAEPFDFHPYMNGALGGLDRQQRHSSRDLVFSREEESSISAQAPQQKRAKAKKKDVVPFDSQLVILNSDMKLWQLEYLKTMSAAKLTKEANKANKQAKNNAFHFVLGSGLNGVGNDIGAKLPPGPLAMFAGESLLALISGKEYPTVPQTPSNIKRAADTLLSSPSKRLRESEQGRGTYDEDGGIVMMDDDQSHSIEVGRDAASALPDVPSSNMMPWNVSASLHSYQRLASGSLQGRSGILGSQIGSVAGGWRLNSASPLIGRGSTLPGDLDQFSLLNEDDAPMDYGRSDYYGGSHGLDFAVGGGGGGGYQSSQRSGFHPQQQQQQQDNEFEMFGQAANVDTQTAATSQWIRDALDKESSNFFEYVQNTLSEKTAAPLAADNGAEQQFGREGKDSVTFEELFDIEKNSRIVAAQAFYHVLCLATKSKVWVEQDIGRGKGGAPEPWGEIRIGVF